jgi:hypothetical protein
MALGGMRALRGRGSLPLTPWWSIDARTVATIRDLLKQAFTNDEVIGGYDACRAAHFYGISTGKSKALRHRVLVSREFLVDHTADELPAILRSWDFVERVKTAGAKTVLVSSRGIETRID